MIRFDVNLLSSSSVFHLFLFPFPPLFLPAFGLTVTIPFYLQHGLIAYNSLGFPPFSRMSSGDPGGLTDPTVGLHFGQASS